MLCPVGGSPQGLRSPCPSPSQASVVAVVSGGSGASGAALAETHNPDTLCTGTQPGHWAHDTSGVAALSAGSNKRAAATWTSPRCSMRARLPRARPTPLSSSHTPDDRSTARDFSIALPTTSELHRPRFRVKCDRSQLTRCLRGTRGAPNDACMPRGIWHRGTVIDSVCRRARSWEL